MAPTNPRDVFVGREAELAALDQALAEAAVGRGQLVVLSGEAGIGKTRMAEEVAARAGRHGASSVWGRAWELSGTPDHWPWMQILSGVARRSGARLAEHAGDDAEVLAPLVTEVRALASGGGAWLATAE